jgi:F-type H+-transporting ATPase subunit gamma
MPNARALDKRRKSIRNIRKITRTMELIATAQFKRAMDRATAAAAYTQRITQIVSDLANAGRKVSHPLLEPRPQADTATLLVLSANRGLCGGYNASVVRLGLVRYLHWLDQKSALRLEVSGKRGISAFRFRRIPIDQSMTQFDDQPSFADVEKIADRYLEDYTLGRLDRLEVVYTRFLSRSRQQPVAETLLPLGSLIEQDASAAPTATRTSTSYEFLPSAESILQEIVPTSFKVRLYQCFLDAAVSEQIARMMAMKGATDNASEMIKQLSMTYNRARQSQITTEIMDIIGGVEALG